MKFQVPGSVLAQISEYDPAQPKAEKTLTSKRNTLGLVNDLFPADIVPVETQNEWAVQINNLKSQHRFKVLDIDTSHAILYTTSIGWVGLWYTKPGHQDHGQYIFGFSLAYKPTPKSLERFAEYGSTFEGTSITLESVSPHTSVKYGRVSMRKHTRLVTTSDIIEWDIYRVPSFGFSMLTYSSSRCKALNDFIRGLVKTIPTYEVNPLHIFPHTDIFQRMQREKAPIKVFSALGVGKQTGDLKDDIKTLVSTQLPNISHIIHTPFFDKETSNVANEVKDLLNRNYPKTRSEDRARTYIEQCRSLSVFVTIYGEDVNTDYCQRIWKAGDKFVRSDEFEFNKAYGWIRDNVPVSSMVNMTERSDHTTIVDTFGMLDKIITCDPNSVLPKPKRWRMDELHDMVNEELYKVTNPNLSLPQDLFPEPIKVDNFTFFQPIDTHQLAKWGRAVRNCIGNSSHYASQVKRKLEFIVLALNEGKPHFTIQLNVRDGVMSVRQIVKQNNNRLTELESIEYAEKFSEALKVREAQLTAQV